MLFSFIKKFNIGVDFGKLNFLIGIFLLPSAFSISLIFLLTSLIISTYKNKGYILTDRYNIILIFASFLLIISSAVHSLKNEFALNYNWDISLSWIGLANWIPLFWCFYGFQYYAETPNERKNIALVLLSGTFPVIISGIGQSFFNWNGPFKTLGGIVVWYQRPLENITGLTGLFNNPNYAGIWLNLIWPFCLAFLIINRKSIFQLLPSFLFTFGISLTTVLTNSRSAWVGIVFGSILILGRKIIKIIPTLSLATLIILFSSIIPSFSKIYESIFNVIIPNQNWISFDQSQLTRNDIWLSAMQSIIRNPFFGTGAGSFPKIFLSETGVFKGHTHNLILELMLSYGIPAALTILLTILIIFLVSFRKIYLKNYPKDRNHIFEKAWIISLLIFIVSQTVDVQYFDGRISILFWILLAGARNIAKTNLYNKN